MLTRSPDSFADDLGRPLCPDEWRWMVVPVVDVVMDVADELFDGNEGPSSHGASRQDPEPRFDHVEPRCSRRREVKVDVRMRLEPGLHIRSRVSGGVVENDMK